MLRGRRCRRSDVVDVVLEWVVHGMAAWVPAFELAGEAGGLLGEVVCVVAYAQRPPYRSAHTGTSLAH